MGVIKNYGHLLPVTEKTPKITLEEGSTPLVYYPAISRDLGINLYGKLEMCNPTGSFKDRGMVLAVAKALEDVSVIEKPAKVEGRTLTMFLTEKRG